MRMVVVMMMMISTEFFVKDGPLLDLQGEFSRASFPSTFAASSVTTLALAAALAAAAVRAAALAEPLAVALARSRLRPTSKIHRE